LEQILRNCKKAAAFAKKKLKPDGLFNSGNNADNLWEYVLVTMYEYLKIIGAVDDDNDDDNDSIAAGVRPSSWYFR
jgi:hypothetical protein